MSSRSVYSIAAAAAVLAVWAALLVGGWIRRLSSTGRPRRVRRLGSTGRPKEWRP
jgi:hypothetical protein